MQSLEIQLTDAWQLAVADFTARGTPLVRRTAVIAPADLQASWSRCVASVRTTFAAHYGGVAIDERFHVPEDYATFVPGHRRGMVLAARPGMVIA